VGIIFRRVAGLDVDQDRMVACVRLVDRQGKLKQIVRTFGTMTNDLLELLDWLTSCRVTHVAVESAQEFWKAVWNIMDEQDMTRMAGRGRNSMRKKIQGRKETLEGGMNEHHRFMLKHMHSYLQSLDQQVSTFDVRIDEVLRACLTTDPGAAS
jgi:hypothetical protein